jgi:hypothetical protein
MDKGIEFPSGHSHRVESQFEEGESSNAGMTAGARSRSSLDRSRIGALLSGLPSLAARPPGADQQPFELPVIRSDTGDREQFASLSIRTERGSGSRSSSIRIDEITTAHAPVAPARSWRESIRAAASQGWETASHGWASGEAVLRQGLAKTKARFVSFGQASGHALHRGYQIGRKGVTGIYHGGAAVAGSVGESFVQLHEMAGLPLPGKDTLGAAAGHLIHQAVAVGIPTFGREIGAVILVKGLEHLPDDAVTGLQAAVGAFNMAAQMLRMHRERRDPAAAARGFHVLTQEEWDALPEPEQDALCKTQRAHSALVTSMTFGATMANLAVGLHGRYTGNPAVARNVLAGDVKTIVYTAARDTIQATFRLVDFQEQPRDGVSGTHLTAAAMNYGGTNVVANLAWSSLPAHAAAGHDGMQALVRSSAMKAAINTSLEAGDWFSVTRQQANQSGTRQIWKPAIKATRADYGRLLDQSPARIAVISSTGAVGNLISHFGSGMPADVQLLLGSAVPAAWAGLTYKTIAGTWGADGAVRDATDDQRALSPDRPDPTTMRR